MGPVVETLNDEPHLTFSIRVSGGASDITVIPQVSSDLVTWSSNDATLQLLESTPGDDGRVTLKYYDTAVLTTNAKRFVRFQFKANY
jgi:hypothetical protein